MCLNAKASISCLLQMCVTFLLILGSAKECFSGSSTTHSPQGASRSSMEGAEATETTLKPCSSATISVVSEQLRLGLVGGWVDWLAN